MMEIWGKHTAKTKEELNNLKQEYTALLDKLKELDENELNEVAGGSRDDLPKKDENEKYVMSANQFIAIPLKPIYSKKCQNKPCNYSSKVQCPYYSDEVGDCDK